MQINKQILLTQEDKIILIFKPLCNFLLYKFIIDASDYTQTTVKSDQ